MSDIDKRFDFTLETVKKAGEILKKYYVSRDFTQTSKGGVDFLTQADKEVDDFLIARITKAFPKDFLLTEETAPKDYSQFEHKENVWVIDPLDGTINFARENTNFSISVGVVTNGQPYIGIVYVPMLDLLYTARADKENALLNGQPIRVTPTEKLGESIVACDWSWDMEHRKKVISWLSAIAPHVRAIRSLGSAAADMSALGSGKIDCYIHSGIKPWDTAAAALILQKAGGIITKPSGQEWNIFSPDILAGSPTIHKEILQLITS